MQSPGTVSGGTCQSSRHLGKQKQENPKFRVLLGDVRFASINNGTKEGRKVEGREGGSVEGNVEVLASPLPM